MIDQTRVARATEAARPAAQIDVLVRTAAYLGAFASLVGLSVLYGWIADIPRLKSIHHSFVSMKVNTAVSFTLIGGRLSYLLVSRPACGLGVQSLPSALVFAIGALSLSEYVFHIELGIDHALAPGVASGHRMSEATALGFTMLGVALILIDLRQHWAIFGLQALALANLSLFAMCDLGYLYGVNGVYASSFFSTVALHTALLMTIVSIAVLLVRSDQALVQPLTADTPSAALARRMLIAIVLIPTFIGWLRLYGQRAGYYGTEFGVTIFATINILCLASLAWFFTLGLSRSERERMRTQTALAASEDKLRTTLYSIADGVIATDDFGIIERMNPVAEQLTGWCFADAQGRNLEQVFRALDASSQPLHVLSDADLPERTSSVPPSRCKLIARDGVERWIEPNISAMRESSGVRRGFVVVFRDVSEQVVAQAAAQRVAERMGILAELTRELSLVAPSLVELSQTIAQRLSKLLGDACVIRLISADGTSLDTDLAAAYDTDPELLAMLRELVTMTPIRVGEGLSGTVAASGESIIFDVDASPNAPMIPPQGMEFITRFHIGSMLFVQLNARGRSIGVIALCRRKVRPRYSLDERRWVEELASRAALALENARLVTTLEQRVRDLAQLDSLRQKSFELESENRRAVEANRLKSEFLANMSHELRTPLNAIVGFARLLLAGKAGVLGATQKEYLGDILSGGLHLNQIIDDVLDLVKVESGRIDLNLERIELAPLIDEVESVCKGYASNRDLRFERYIDSQLGSVLADKRLVKQILYNLISNAIKFTPEGGLVKVHAAPVNDDTLEILVEDTGIGIRQEDLPRLFVEFQQLDSSASKKYAGTGLGLALTKRLVELHGGQISARSVFGKGSVFRATLSRRTPPLPDMAPQSSDPDCHQRRAV